MRAKIERLKRMAINVGAIDQSDAFVNVERVVFDDESLHRFACSIAEECARECESVATSTFTHDYVPSEFAEAIRSLYRDKP